MKLKSFAVIAGALLFADLMFVGGNAVLADAEETEEVVSQTRIEEEASPCGFFTELSLSIDGSDGEVYATVKNAFTLLPSTVQVILDLYYSPNYQYSYTDMTLAARDIVGDLNMGKSLTVYASTNGEQLWWTARIYYKIDSKDWQETYTDAALFDEYGNRVST